MTEDVIFSTGEVRIDKTLARFGSASYPIANIGSVAVKTIPAPRKPLGVGFCAVGFAIAVYAPGYAYKFIGIFIIALGVLIYILSKQKFAIYLRTSSSDQQAFESTNAALISEIKSALETAIASRG